MAQTNVIGEVLRLERLGNPFIAAQLAVKQLSDEEIAYCARRMPHNDRVEFERYIARVQELS
jgi:hypothetical protein